ncbi:phosphatidylserine decarboxylase [Salipaludibacillus sp. LMS25]|jgi:phosphatidylserine decarboxylase|uniref:phosphatidylserine decarboxylase n=1 Tax=Salipaludibacillus sp. LMS25 TaxID=2924031 RepID=UPI0020D0B25E|nr:phosphatidylserine decarboxylase [Salipaludibacillus sp. LMS25]UTR14332.1 phosphatidylserine decarboxylase [Salipaludibacillus sp. LMS25]
MKKSLYRLMLELTHNPLYNVMLKKAATHRWSRAFIPSFSKTFNINTDEVARQQSEFHHLNDFFSRELKEGSRPVSQDVHEIVSPVDGVLAEVGDITDKTLMHIKQKPHSLETMLGLKSAVNTYLGGKYYVFYLSPKDYHRIHAPYAGHVRRRWALGRYSEPVNHLGFYFGQEPLATNYRLITEYETAKQRFAVVKIGALNVNSIHLSHTGSYSQKGEEMGYFSFGSTVVLLFQQDTVKLAQWIIDANKHDLPIKQGETIGSWIKQEETSS